ncbi:MAG: HepT-like ribonuclease domain-containing protein, partial [Chloroflexota bacterium]
MKREYSLFVKDILEAIEKIEEFVGNIGFDEFVRDDKTSSAVVRKLEVCIIRPMPTSDSDGCRPPIPGHADHLFRWHGVHFLGDTGIRGC